jgi:carboxyl-terminal processing protease
VEVRRVPRSFPAYELRVTQGIAVLEIRDLARVDADDLALELDHVRSRGLERLMLDLRNACSANPRDAIPVVELFAVGPLLRLAERSGVILETLEAVREEPVWSGPVAVLVNGASAGGAEAVAQLLRSERSAKIYGETTYGLGSEPRLFELSDGSALVLSAALWQTRAGQTWNRDGVEPDLIVRGLGRSEETQGDQLERALEAFGEEPTSGIAERKAA